MNILGFLRGRKKTEGDYYDLLPRIHSLLKPSTYAEIGVNRGATLRMATTARAAIGIDPGPVLEAPLAPSARLFRMTSDEFFATHNLATELGGRNFDLAFIDGMHLFENALRDFVNLERAAAPGSTILLHDCYPIDRETAQRERATTLWTGDVWKLVVCLKKHRPDLEIWTIDVPPSGLGVVRRLNPDSTLLSSRLEELYAEFVPMDYGVIETGKAEKLNRVNNRWSEIRAALARA